MTLVGATVAGVWGDIFHYPDDETVLDDTLACVRWMYSEWDGLSGWMGFRKVCPGIRLWSGMQFPVEGSGGKCDPEFAIGVGWSFPTEPQAETASRSGREFWDTVSGCKKGHMTWPSTYICLADTPMTSRVPTTRRLSGRRYVRFIASSARKGGHLMWPPSCAGLSEQGTSYVSARTDVSVMNSQLVAT